MNIGGGMAGAGRSKGPLSVVGVLLVALVAGLAALQQAGVIGGGGPGGAGNPLGIPVPGPTGDASAGGRAQSEPTTGPSSGDPAAAPGTTPTTPSGKPTEGGQPGASAGSAGGTVRIGSWNIEWLGMPEKRSGPAKGKAQRAEDLARYIEVSGVSILALQEIIATGGTNPPRSKELDAAFEALRASTGRRWEYVLFEGRRAEDQLTGVAWDVSVATAVDAGGEAWGEGDGPITVAVAEGRGPQGSGLWNRRPRAVKLSLGAGKTDVVLISVHMKSDFDGSFIEHREMEARALVKALPGLRAGLSDQDVIVLGDTNVTDRSEGALAAYAEGGLVDLNREHAATHWRGGIMDRVFVPGGQPEFEGSEFGVLSPGSAEGVPAQPRELKEALSDHYLVFATVRVMSDDD